MTAPTARPFSRTRIFLGVLVALVIGGMLAAGLSAPAFASPLLTDFTVKVTNKAGAPLAGVFVQAFQVADGEEAPDDVPATAVAVAGKPGYYKFTTAVIAGDGDSNGNSQLTVGGTYTLAFAPTGTAAATSFGQYLGGVSSIANATTFTVSAVTPSLAVSLASNGVISGLVTSATGAVLKNAFVQSYFFDGSNWVLYSSTSTLATGRYTLTDLEPGSYKLEFYPFDGSAQPIFSGNKPTLAAAVPVYVALGATVGANAKFVVGTGTISGTVLADFGDDGFGDDLEYMDGAVAVAFPVTQFDPDGTTAAAYDTDAGIYGKPSSAKGVWSITGIPAGKYIVQIQPEYWNETTQFLNLSSNTAGGDQELGLLSNEATVFTVTAASKTPTGVSELVADPNQGGYLTVSAYTTDATLAGGGLDVTATRISDPYDFYTGTTDADGSVTFGLGDDGGEIQPGAFSVVVTDPTGEHEPSSAADSYVYVRSGFNQSEVLVPTVTVHPGFSSQPAIAETSTKVGTTYTVAATAARSDATLGYQWLRNGSAIFGATDASYTSKGGDLGAQISVRVAASSFGFDPVFAYAAVGSPMPAVETVGDAATVVTAPQINAVSPAYLGTTLHTSFGSWSASGLTYNYQWLRDGVAITGATKSTYVVTAADLGLPVTAQITATESGYTDSLPSVSSNSVTPIVHPAATVVKSPSVTGAAVKKGTVTTTTYSVAPGTWSLAGVTFTYAWTAPDGLGGSLGSNTGKSLSTNAFTTLPTEPITVTITAHKVGYADSTPVTLVARKATIAYTDATAPVVSDVTTSIPVDPTSTPLVGDKLTVTDPGEWSLPDPDSALAPDSYAYAWFRKVGTAAPVAIAGATTSSYTIATADVHALLSVRVTPVSKLYAATASTVGVGTGTTNPALLDGPATVSLTGIAAVGGTLTGAVGWPTAGVASTYQWFTCTVTALKDCTNTTMFTKIAAQTKVAYAPTVAGTYVYLGVTGTKAGFSGGTAASSITPIAAASVVTELTVPTVTVSADAKAHVGVAAVAVTGKFAGPVSVKTYQWQVCAISVCGDGDWADVTGATAASYVPTATVYGTGTSSIRVVEKLAVGPALAPTFVGTYPSAAHPLSTGTLKLVAAPKVTKTIVAGVTKYSVTPGSWLPAVGTGTVTYHWLVDGVDSGIADASQTPIDSTTITPQSSVTLSTSFATQGYPTYSSTILAQAGIITPPVAASTLIAGTKLGDTLSIADPFIYPTTANVTPVLAYQWYSNNVAIAGQVHSTFAPTYPYVAHNITVRVTATAPYFAAATYLSPAVLLQAGTFGVPAAPVIVSASPLTPASVASIQLGSYGTTGITYKYAWQVSATGATWTTVAATATYAPLAAYAGDQLRVSVAATKAGYTGSSLLSTPVVIAYPPLAMIDPAAITGSPVAGGVLTANPGTWNLTGTTFTYQWLRNGIAIPGETATTMTVLASSFGDELSVRITANHAASTPMIVTTNTLVVAQAAAPVATVLPKITGTAPLGYTVSTGTWNVDGLTFTYQWNANGVAIDGATTDSYTPPAPTQGQSITVTIAATRSGYAEGSATSAAVLAPHTN